MPPANGRSLHVVKRASFKLIFFAAAAAAQAAAGYGFLRPLATLITMSAVAAAMFGLWLGDKPTARDYTYFDEAAWFLVLGFVLRRFI